MKNEAQIKVCFLADKHSLYDDRIYWKMAVFLIEEGYDVNYILIGDNDEIGTTKEGVHFEMIKLNTFSKNKYLNFILKFLHPRNNYKKMLFHARKVDADIYHLHDLWINRIGRKLKKIKRKPVLIYDVHEPYAEDFKTYSLKKGWNKTWVRMISLLMDKWEKYMVKDYDLIITTEEIVGNRFREVVDGVRVEEIYNYSENYKNYIDIQFDKKEYDFIYSGIITELRGAFKILEATKLMKIINPDVKVVFVGNYSPPILKDEMLDFIESNDLIDQVELHSFVDYKKISNYYNKSKVGFLTPFPEPNFKIKMYIKLFEYMAFGMPVIGSDFGHIKEVLSDEKCGILVDSLDENEISKAMIRLMKEDSLYESYSRNGRRATLDNYKWEFEFKKLIKFYSDALAKRKS